MSKSTLPNVIFYRPDILLCVLLLFQSLPSSSCITLQRLDGKWPETNRGLREPRRSPRRTRYERRAATTTTWRLDAHPHKSKLLQSPPLHNSYTKTTTVLINPADTDEWHHYREWAGVKLQRKIIFISWLIESYCLLCLLRMIQQSYCPVSKRLRYSVFHTVKVWSQPRSHDEASTSPRRQQNQSHRAASNSVNV